MRLNAIQTPFGETTLWKQLPAAGNNVDAMLAASVFHLPSAPGSMQQLFDGRENTTAVEGKDFCRLTIMSHKAVIVWCRE